MSRADTLFGRAFAADARVFGEPVSVGSVPVTAIAERSAEKVELFGLVDAERVDATLELPAAHAGLAVYGALVVLADGSRWRVGARLKRDAVSAVYALKEDA